MKTCLLELLLLFFVACLVGADIPALSDQEKAAAAQRLLEKYDVDKSGTLSMEELRGLAQDHSVTQEKKKGLNREQFTQKFGARIGREGKHDVADVFTTLDSDKDSFISRTEMPGVTEFLDKSEV